MCVFFFLFTSARCHFPARGEWGVQSRVNQSVASWRHRSVPLSPPQDEEGGPGPQNLSDYFSPLFSLSFIFLRSPGKQLCAIQITCQSGAVMKVHFAV